MCLSIANVPCDAGGADDGYWIGFDCGHGMDLPDPALRSEGYKELDARTHGPWAYSASEGCAVRSQEYVEAECRSLCEQANEAKNNR